MNTLKKLMKQTDNDLKKQQIMMLRSSILKIKYLLLLA